MLLSLFSYLFTITSSWFLFCISFYLLWDSRLVKKSCLKVYNWCSYWDLSSLLIFSSVSGDWCSRACLIKVVWSSYCLWLKVDNCPSYYFLKASFSSLFFLMISCNDKISFSYDYLLRFCSLLIFLINTSISIDRLLDYFYSCVFSKISLFFYSSIPSNEVILLLIFWTNT